MYNSFIIMYDTNNTKNRREEKQYVVIKWRRDIKIT